MNQLFIDQIQSNQKEFVELTQDILTSNLLVIGEIHGVKENAFLYYSLFKLFEFDTIVLGYPISLREPVRNFLTTGIFPIHSATENLSNGNVNKTYLLMLKQLYTEGLLKNVIFIEPDNDGFPHWNDKEKASFENFQSQYSRENKTLVVLGDIHTETEPFAIETKQKFESGSLIPLALHLRQHLGDFPICKLFYHSGKFYNFGIKDFPKTHMPEHMLRKKKSEDKKYEIHLSGVNPVDTF